MECPKISKYIKCKYSHKRIKSQRLLNCIRVYIYYIIEGLVISKQTLKQKQLPKKYREEIILWKWVIHKKDTVILIVYSPTKKASKYKKPDW